jgi:hypothetical protein
MRDLHDTSATAEPTAEGGASPGKTARTATIQRKARGPTADAGEAVASLPAIGGTPLPDATRARFESSLGTDLSQVRLHDGPASARASDELGARAFATGEQVHFGAGEHRPDDPYGMHLVAHEVAHTVQQRGGSGVQAKPAVSEPGDRHEVEADRAADAMVAGRPAVVTAGGAATIQRRADAEAVARAGEEPGRAKDRAGEEPAREKGRAVDGANSELDRRTDGDHQNADGSGEWGGQADDRGVTDRASWYMWSRVATVAEGMGLTNAARHMRHYLGNTGDPLTVSVDNMLRDVPAFSTAYDTELDEARQQVHTRLAGQGPVTAPQTFTLTGSESSSVYCQKSQSQDWFFAIGGFTHWWTAEVTVTPPEGEAASSSPDRPNGGPPHVTMRFTMHMRDNYNWDQGKSVSILGVNVSDEQLGRLHRVGLAREFAVSGQSSARVVDWTEAGAPPAPSAGAAPVGGSRDGGRSDPTRDGGSIRGNVRGSDGAPRGR